MKSTMTPLDDGPAVLDATMRNRFVAFAFVAADLLVEASPDGIISFTAGAFMARLGASPESFLGCHISVLVAPVDQTRFEVAIATSTLRGRSAPMLMRLADRRNTAVAVASLLVPGPPPRLCLTFGAPALSASAAGEDASPLLTEGATSIVHAAAQRMLAAPADAGQVGLLELKGWADARRQMEPADHERLRLDIGGILAASAPGSLASELADGKFTVLASPDLDLGAVVERLEQLLGASPAAASTSVAHTKLKLGSEGLAPAQAMRALRFALTCFADRGTEGALAIGGGEGLSGIMARAGIRVVAMRQAIVDRRFRLRFQPIARLADRRVHHYEALLRPTPTPGNPVTSPQEYVTFVELVGLVQELDAAVLEEAIATLRASPNVSVAINVSGLTMQNPEFCDMALAAIEAAGLDGRLIMELTETAEVTDIAAAAAHMKRFRAAGVPLCLDDFGSGAASFRYLRDFTFDFVKIDGSYVRKASQNPRERGFVSSIVDLARSAEARTVAEMIETEAQARLMQDLGVDFGQGWLLGRPGKLPG